MKPLSYFVSTDYSSSMCLRYGECLENIEAHFFSHMLRALKKYETQNEKINFLERVHDRPYALQTVQDIAQLGLFMKADDRFHEILKEYGRES